MKKNNVLTLEVKKMKRMINKMPKNLNEAMTFEADDEFTNDMQDDFEDEQPQQMQQEEPKRLDVASFVDDIRKKSLKGMAELADSPDSQEYQLLKKIWQICDKKPEQEQPVQQHQQM